MPAELFANAYATTLSGAIDDVTTTLTVADSPPEGLTGGGQFRVLVEAEYLLVTAVGGSGNLAWTVARGQEGSSAASHNAGVSVTQIVTAGSLGVFEQMGDKDDPDGYAGLDSDGMLSPSVLPISVVTTDTDSGFVIQPSADVTPLTLQGTTGQSAPIFVLSNSAGQHLVSIDPSGSIDTHWRGGNSLHHLGNIAPVGSFAAAHYFYGSNGQGPNHLAWSMGIDTAAAIPYRDFFIGKVNPDNSVGDFFYLSYANSNGPPYAGVGWVPGRGDYALSVSGHDADTTQGGLAIRVSTQLKGNVLALIDSASGNPRLWLDKNCAWGTDGTVQAGMMVKAANTAYPKPSLLLADSDGSTAFGFRHGSDGSITFRYFPTAQNVWSAHESTWRHLGSGLGFFSTGGVTQQVITGSRGANAALASLLTALAHYGLIVDHSTT